MSYAFPFVRPRNEDRMTVVRTRSDDHTVCRVVSLTAQEVLTRRISRAYVGTELGYEFQLYVGREGIFLASVVEGASPDENFPEGHVWLSKDQTELSVGLEIEFHQSEPYLRVIEFVISYIEIPYTGT